MSFKMEETPVLISKHHPCERCGKVFSKRSNLKTHYQNKILCTNKLGCTKSVEELLSKMIFERTNLKFECVGCHKKFRTKSNLNQHSDHCKLVDIMTEDQTDPLILWKKIDDLEKKIDTLQTNITINNPTINNNTIVVVLNNFGAEDTTHVLNDVDFLDKCLLAFYKGVPNVVERIYYDKNKPENKTVLVKSAKRQTALVYMDGIWIEKNFNQVVPLMVKNGSTILSNHLTNKTELYHEETTYNDKKQYLRYLSLQKKPMYDQIASAVKAIMCNHRNE